MSHTYQGAQREGFTPPVQVYEPHRGGLPPLRLYVRTLWQRRQFAVEMSRTSIRAANTNTFFGQLWLVINPLLLAAVYYLLVTILQGGSGDDPGHRFVHLCAGLFAFYFFAGEMQSGAASVVGGGKLLLNMSFPRMLLPLSAVRTAFIRFLPTLIVYFPIHFAFGQGLHWQMLLSPVFLLLLTVFGAGMAMVFAALQVYFRDTTSFLPYVVRIWLYLSPILWFAEDAPARFRQLMILNPLFSLIGGWTDLLVRGEIPGAVVWITAVGWALGALLAGSLFFVSREREFAVRV